MSRYTGGGGFLPLTWWLAGSSIDLYFSQGKYFDSSLGEGQLVTNYVSVSRASAAYAKNSVGTWVSFATNTLRITDLGLLTEDSHTNFLLNNTAPVTQTTGSLATGTYTLWVEGSGSATSSAGSATITGGGAATAGSPNIFTVTVAGTVVVTVAGSVTLFQLEDNYGPTSRIDTAGSTATRSQDLVTLIGSAKTIVQAIPASIVTDVQLLFVGQSARYNVTGDNNARFQIENSNTIMSWQNSSNNGPAVILGGSNTWTGGAKGAFAQSSGGVSITCTGATLGTDGTSQQVIGTTNSFLGSRSGGADNNLNGYFRRLTLWNSRLADATLQGFAG